MTLDISAWREVDERWRDAPPEVFMLHGEIDRPMGERLCSSAQAAKKEGKDLLVFIASNGGLSWVSKKAEKDWFPMVRKGGGRVMTVAIGNAGSAASHLLVSGDRGYRLAHTKATVLIHGASVYYGGYHRSESELGKIRESLLHGKSLANLVECMEISYVKKALRGLNRWQVRHYATYTMLTPHVLQDMCFELEFQNFTAEEAEKVGIVDGVGLPETVMKHYYEATKDGCEVVVGTK